VAGSTSGRVSGFSHCLPFLTESTLQCVCRGALEGAKVSLLAAGAMVAEMQAVACGYLRVTHANVEFGATLVAVRAVLDLDLVSAGGYFQFQPCSTTNLSAALALKFSGIALFIAQPFFSVPVSSVSSTAQQGPARV